MARKAERLDDVQLRHWVRAGEPVAKADGKGLTFTLSRSGCAAWILRYRHGGKAREVTIGNYPTISLKAARKKAEEHRNKISDGEDVAVTKRREKAAAAAAWTVKRLVKSYREHKLPALRASTRPNYERNLKRIEEGLGTFQVRIVEAKDIITLIEDSGLSWRESALLLVVCRVLFDHAVGRKVITANPAAGIPLADVLGMAPVIRQRVMLSEAELKQLLAAPLSNERNRLAARILLTTCVRSGELVRAEWKNIDLKAGVWHIPEEDVKTGRATDIPLAPVVVEWFEKLRRLAGDSVYVLPARKRARVPVVHKDFLNTAIKEWRKRFCPDTVRVFTAHDLRSTARSYLAALGVPAAIAEACLNHKQAGVVGIYDRYNYFDERREALAKLVRFVCLHEPVTNVIPLHATEAA